MRLKGHPKVGRGKAIAAVLILAAALALLGFGIVFSNSFGAAKVASNARALHWTNATLDQSGLPELRWPSRSFSPLTRDLASLRRRPRKCDKRGSQQPCAGRRPPCQPGSDEGHGHSDRVSRFVSLAGRGR